MFTYTPNADGSQVVRIDGRRIGVVRRARALETVNMAGRTWVAVHGGRVLAGNFDTRKAASESLLNR